MTKAERVALEKLFEWEVNSALDKSGWPPPPQLGKAVAARLEAQGLAEPVVTTLPGWPPVTVSGHVLTHKGRMVYCACCEGEEETR